ncbi:MAG TPA: FIST N-terminal domain-containing protein [Thermoleophilaceae bacterium]
MAVKIGTGLVVEDAGFDSFAEAAGRAALALGGAPADLVFVFAGAANLVHVEQGLAHVQERLRPRAVVGCGAQGVVGSGHEVEQGGVAVWAASLPDAELQPFRLETLEAGDSVAITGMPELDRAEAMFMLVDPYSFPAEPLLDQIAEDHPGLPVLGGLASAGGGPGSTLLMLDGDVVTDGAVGVTLAGVEVWPCVSQGARPIGPEMAITAAEANVIHELASRPALERLKTAITELEPAERALAAAGLLIGIVIDENRPEYERGDFLVRGLLGADEETGSIAVGERVRIGQTVRLHVRDSDSADEDLREALARVSLGLSGPPAGALIFTCNGRGSQMFPAPDHDASAVEHALSGAPAAGFFCAGEIGPVGTRSFVHGFTATMAVFPG